MVTTCICLQCLEIVENMVANLFFNWKLDFYQSFHKMIFCHSFQPFHILKIMFYFVAKGVISSFVSDGFSLYFNSVFKTVFRSTCFVMCVPSQFENSLKTKQILCMLKNTPGIGCWGCYSLAYYIYITLWLGGPGRLNELGSWIT
jgi:hypothetical protein